MFFHQYFYRLKYIFHSPELLFWPLAFPLLLGTIFFATFGISLNKEIGCKTIPVAVISGEEKETEMFRAIMDEVRYENNTLMFAPDYCSESEAKEKLNNNDVIGIINLNEDFSLTVASSGFSQSIVKAFLDQYRQQAFIIQDISKQNPAALSSVIDELSSDAEFIAKKSITGKDMNGLLQYYYALIAMASLFGCYMGLDLSQTLIASQSTLAMRRCTSSANKSVSILADFSAAVSIHFVELIIVWCYMFYILKIPVGSPSVSFFFVLLLGSMLGISFGQFVGTFSKSSEGVRIAILTGGSLASCFLSGLMVAQIKGALEKYAPFVNRINPATLVTDAIYCLDVYSDNLRFIQDLVTLLLITGVFLITNFLLIRRERYDNL